MIYLVLICLVIIGFLGFKLYQKQTIDRAVIEKLDLEHQTLKAKVEKEQREYEDLFKKTQKENLEYFNIKQKSDFEKQRIEEYQDLINNKFSDIDTQIEEQRLKRQAELEQALADKQAYYNKLLEDTIKQCNLQNETIKEASEAKCREAIEQIEQYNESIAEAKERFESIERTLAQYEKDKQAKLFYTIQLPEEFHEDIDYLLTIVSTKVRHPDIISKLVWTTYVKPYLDELCKRTDIKDEPGIYKITNINSGKSYIGKSTNVKKRIQDHCKSVVGLSTISDQAVHHAILKEGFWNWSIEVITYCDKDKLSELEKYYIEFFKSQEFGYNRNSGG